MDTASLDVGTLPQLHPPALDQRPVPPIQTQLAELALCGAAIPAAAMAIAEAERTKLLDVLFKRIQSPVLDTQQRRFGSAP
jgi:hypothetical protein